MSASLPPEKPATIDDLLREPHRWRIIELHIDQVVYESEDGQLLFVHVPNPAPLEWPSAEDVTKW